MTVSSGADTSGLGKVRGWRGDRGALAGLGVGEGSL